LYNYFSKIIVFFLFIIILIACDATKRVPEGKYLLEKNRIFLNDKKSTNQETLSFLRQTPNLKVLGVPFSLYLYNLANPNYQTHFEDWLKNHPKKEKKLTKKFSKKQVTALGRTYKGINSWFMRNGNPPVISDSVEIEKSVISLKKYFISKGYFDATVRFKERKKAKNKSVVDYFITTKEPYTIDSITKRISTPLLDSIYNNNKKNSFLVKGKQIEYQNLEKEEDRIVKLYRNSGVYHFGKNIVQFWIDTLNTTHKTVVSLNIPDRIIEKGDSVYKAPFKSLQVKRVNVFTDFKFDTKDLKPQDSVNYRGYVFYANEKLKYNPKYLSNAILINPDGIYKDDERDFTRKYLRELQNFRSAIDIKYVENKDESLTTNIYLTPLKKYSLGFDTEITTSNIKPFGILGKFSLFNRNVFKGAEILELSFQGSFLNISKDVSDNSNFFNAWEVGSNASLKIPRILFPIKTSGLIPKRMTPKTNLNLSLSFQRNIGLDRQNLTGSMDYTWKSSENTNHKFELLNVQYIKNQNTDNYFIIFNSEYEKLKNVAESLLNVPLENENSVILDFLTFVLDPSNNYETTNEVDFLEVQKVKERRLILIEDVLVPVLSYTYNYINKKEIKDNDFSTFTGRIISSGSLTSAFVNKTDSDGKKILFGLPVAQYLKGELEYKKYWGINKNTALVYRSFLGAAIPFGNSNSIPFSRSYRAGGSNDIRAWRNFSLGPGSENNSLEFNTGSLKFTTNLEYRFKVLNSFYSAFFMDAGNIWDITNSQVTSKEGKFNGLSSLKDIAIGSGFGIRYDFNFLVFRFDIGFKTYEPYLLNSSKWFQNYNFNHAVYNIGINYPF
jgi:hypothetical protein